MRGERVQPETHVGETALVDGRDTAPVGNDHGGRNDSDFVGVGAVWDGGHVRGKVGGELHVTREEGSLQVEDMHGGTVWKFSFVL